jgi:hypothetical protein
VAPAVIQGRCVAGVGGRGGGGWDGSVHGITNFVGLGAAASTSGGELSEAFTVSVIKMSFQNDKCLIGGWELSPIFDCIKENTRVFKVQESGADSHPFGDGSMVGGEEAALSDMFPEIFQRLGAGPCTLKVGEVVVEIIGVDGAVGGVEVIEEVECSGCGVPKDVVI